MPWFVSAVIEGRPYFAGSFETQEDALQDGYSVTEGDFETIELQTRDFTRAKSILRMRLKNQGVELREVFQRAKPRTFF